MNLLPCLFFIAVCITAFMLMRVVESGIFGETRRERREFEREFGKGGLRSGEPKLLRRPHLEQLTPFERKIESRREFQRLRRLIEEAGLITSIYRVILEMLICALAAAAVVMTVLPIWWAILISAVCASTLPIVRLWLLRQRRAAKVEAQLADAIDMVKRSLRAGNPFISTFRLVADSMDEPIASEFSIAAADLSYGSDPRTALLAMLDRVPSVSLRGFVTAILVQRETGGNLAETLEHLSSVIRERFRFERKLRTLTAEGRLSAWILIAVPFVLGAILFVSAPKYLNGLLESPQGPMLIGGCIALMLVGVIWMRRIARVEI